MNRAFRRSWRDAIKRAIFRLVRLANCKRYLCDCEVLRKVACHDAYFGDRAFISMSSLTARPRKNPDALYENSREEELLTRYAILHPKVVADFVSIA